MAFGTTRFTAVQSASGFASADSSDSMSASHGTYGVLARSVFDTFFAAADISARRRAISRWSSGLARKDVRSNVAYACAS